MDHTVMPRENRMHSRGKTLVALVTAILLSACDGSGNPSAELPTAVGKGFVVSSTIWPSWDIDVCWDLNQADFDKTAEKRQLVQSSVAASWEAASLVRFSGWGMCNGMSKRQLVRIGTEDSYSQTHGFGKQLWNLPRGVNINLTYEKFNTECKSDVNRCIRGNAVHEFGHVLGFDHEQNRDHALASCKKDSADKIKGDYEVGEWDIHSVMNYCNAIWSNDGKLSDGDIQTVQKFYGVPTPPITVKPANTLPAVLAVLGLSE
jgi:predicted Zn-dependent protease